jgi:hypothetical protein
MQPGWNVWEDVVVSFRAANGTTKKIENKIHHGLRRPPMNKSHTTINRKHAGATKEGQERRFAQHRAWGGAPFDRFGDNRVGQGGKKLK